VVPVGKVQSLRLVAGPVQRRLRLASVHVDVAGNGVRAVAAYRDADEAARLLEEIARRARVARGLDRRPRRTGTGSVVE
jgi:putative membrane protein